MPDFQMDYAGFHEILGTQAYRTFGARHAGFPRVFAIFSVLLRLQGVCKYAK